MPVMMRKAAVLQSTCFCVETGEVAEKPVRKVLGLLSGVEAVLSLLKKMNLLQQVVVGAESRKHV